MTFLGLPARYAGSKENEPKEKALSLQCFFAAKNR